MLRQNNKQPGTDATLPVPPVASRMIVDYVADYLANNFKPQNNAPCHLDVGAGWGDLIRRLQEIFPGLHSEGCDYNPHHCLVPGLTIQHVDLNGGNLPYSNNLFDLVTCTEVLEHVENFRHVVREIARVIKHGGMVFISTPNVLNLRSRLYFLLRGFFEYFDPFPFAGDPVCYPGGRHITPITFYYLAQALAEAGFSDIRPGCDKEQKFSRALYPFLAPLARWAAKSNLRRRRRKLTPTPNEVEALALLNNSRPLLTGRTMFVTAVKKA